MSVNVTLGVCRIMIGLHESAPLIHCHGALELAAVNMTE